MTPSASLKVVGLALAVACVVAPASSQAQRASPVHWTFTSKKLAATLYELHMTATIEAGWHIYSQHPGADGPIPTSFKFAKNPSAVPQGVVKEAGRLIKVDPGFGYKVNAYENQVDFVIPVAKRGNGPTSVKGSVEFMATRPQQTLPPLDVDFAINLN